MEQPPPSLDQPQPRPKRRVPWQSILSIVGTIALTIVLVLLPIDASSWGGYSYGAVFVLTLLSSAVIVLPSPALAVAIVASRTLDPLLVGLTAGLAAGLGESTGYILGRSGSDLLRDRQFGQRIERWVRRWGMLTIFVLAVLPTPLFDLAGIAAGSMRLGFWRFLLVVIAGKTARFLLVAYVTQLSVQGSL